MKAKTIVIIIATVILTVFLTVNRDAVEFDFIFGEPVLVSKLVVIGICILIGFILGFLVGRPRKTYSSYDNAIDEAQKQQGLSDEDREYIS